VNEEAIARAGLQSQRKQIIIMMIIIIIITYINNVQIWPPVGNPDLINITVAWCVGK
jgi:hypothetical protein